MRVVATRGRSVDADGEPLPDGAPEREWSVAQSATFVQTLVERGGALRPLGRSRPFAVGEGGAKTRFRGDVSDPTHPHANDSVGLAGRPPYPDDVQSIGFDAASGLLRVPVRQEATGPSQAFPPFEMRVFDVSAERGLTELPAAEKLGIGSPARRTFVLDDDLYPVRFNNVSAYGLPAFDELARLPLPSYYAGRFAWP